MSEKLPTHSTIPVPCEPESRASTLSSAMEKPPIPIAEDVEAVNEVPAEWRPQKQEYLVMLTLATISLMVALDATILVTVLPTIARDLNGSAADSFWVGTSYLLTCAVFQPFIAALSDIFGRRELLFPSLLFFAVGSITCGVAPRISVLLGGRCVQGIGGGGIIVGAQIIFADIVPLRQRPKWFSLVLLAWAIGTVLGPLIGGLFAEKVTWRWAFWINLPFCGIGFLAVLLFVKLETVKTSFKDKLLRVDWLGGFLFISSLTSFLVGLAWAGVEFAWSDYRVLLPLIIGAVGVGASLIWERFGAREPFLRKSLFYEVSSIAAYICALMQGLVLFCSLYYMPFYLMAVQFMSPIAAGVALLPSMCAFLPGSAVVSQLITRLGRFRWAIWSGWLIATLGIGLFILIDVNTKTIVWAAIQVVFGLGSGMILSSVNFGIQAIVRTEDCGRAACMYAFMRTLGMTIGVAIGGTVFQNLMAQKLQDLSLPIGIEKNAEAYIAILKTMAPTDPARIAILEAYVHGFKAVFQVMTGISGIGLLASLLIKHHDMNKVLKSNYRLSRQFE